MAGIAHGTITSGRRRRRDTTPDASHFSREIDRQGGAGRCLPVVDRSQPRRRHDTKDETGDGRRSVEIPVSVPQLAGENRLIFRTLEIRARPQIARCRPHASAHGGQRPWSWGLLRAIKSEGRSLAGSALDGPLGVGRRAYQGRLHTPPAQARPISVFRTKQDHCSGREPCVLA